MKRLISMALALIMTLSAFVFCAEASSGPHVHNWEELIRSYPTCTKTGTKYKYCSECGADSYIDIPALGHQFSKPWTTVKEPTCTEPGTEMNVCQRPVTAVTGSTGGGGICGYEWYREIPALGHDWGEWYVAKQPTATEDGYEERECGRCHIMEQRPIPATGEADETGLFLEVWPLYLDPDEEIKGLGPDQCGVMHFGYRVTNNSEETICKEKLGRYDSQRWRGFSADYVLLEPGESYEDEHWISRWSFEQDQGYADFVLVCEGTTADDGTVNSNEAGLHFDFDDSDPGDGDTGLYLKAWPIGYDEEDGCLYIGYEITNNSEETVYIKGSNCGTSGSEDSRQWRGIDIDSDNYYVALAPDGSASTEGPLYALNPEATQDELEQGYADLWIQGWGINESGTVIYTDIDEVHFNIDGIKPEKLTYSLELKAEITNPKSEYNEGMEDVTVTITNTGTGDLNYISVEAVYQSGGGGFDAFSITSLLPAGKSVVMNLKVKLAYMFSEDDGIETIRFIALGQKDPEKAWDTCQSNAEVLEFLLGWTPPEPEGTTLVVGKYANSYPDNGEYYVEGEDVEYIVYVYNDGDLPAYDIDVYDSLAEGDGQLFNVDKLEPGFGDSAVLVHTVTAEEAQAHALLNTAEAYWYDDSSEYAHFVSYDLWVDTGVFVPDKVSVYKENTNDPVGLYFEPGDWVDYKLTVYNENDWSITISYIDDSLMGIIFTGPFEIPAHGKKEIVYSYQVVDADTIMEVVENTATLFYYDTNGRVNCVVSNSVRVPTGKQHDEPHLSVIMLETSLRPHDGYYWEKDVIDYDIYVLNDGDTDLYDVDVYVYRTLEGWLEIIDTISYLAVNDSVKLTNHTKVTYEDAAYTGWVYNCADADAWIPGYGYVYGNSFMVESPVAMIDPPDDPVEDYKEDYCKLTLDMMQDGCTGYEQYYCAEHWEALKDFYAAVEKAQTDEERLAAWAEVRAAWTAEIDEMYLDWSKSVGPEDIETVSAESKLFYAYLKGCEELYAVTYADDPVAAAEKLCAILAGKCSEMCYELNAPRETRPDSRLSKYARKGGTVETETCTVSYAGGFAQTVNYTVTLCDQHASVDRLVNESIKDLTTDEDRATAFKAGYRKWLTMLNRGVNDRYICADDEGKELIAAYRTLFGDYLNARKAALDVVYAEDPMTAAEVLMNETMREVIANFD